MGDRKLKVREIAGKEGYLSEGVHIIRRQHLNIKKTVCKWVPRLLKVNLKRDRVTSSKDGLYASETWRYTTLVKPKNSPAECLQQNRQSLFFFAGRRYCKCFLDY